MFCVFGRNANSWPLVGVALHVIVASASPFVRLAVQVEMLAKHPLLILLKKNGGQALNLKHVFTLQSKVNFLGPTNVAFRFMFRQGTSPDYRWMNSAVPLGFYPANANICNGVRELACYISFHGSGHVWLHVFSWSCWMLRVHLLYACCIHSLLVLISNVTNPVK